MKKFTESRYFELFRQYEHKISLMKNPMDADLANYPLEYKYFMENGKVDALDYYRHYLIKIFSLDSDSKDYHSVITNFLGNEISSLDNYLINFINNNNFLEKLLRRRQMSYNHYVTHSIGKTPLSSSMLQSYTKAYENDEFLIIWKYFADKLNSKACDLKLTKFRDKGRLIKGKLINDISNKLKNHPKVKSLFDTSYPKGRPSIIMCK